MKASTVNKFNRMIYCFLSKILIFFMVLYPFQPSVTIIEPGRTCFNINLVNVSEFLFGTLIAKNFLSTLSSTPPKSQTPSTACPL
ncbi:hypothetical protein H312_01457 [Anncaliia algerae PRA339]|uniref:Uncharacterized protein n=1 Tax=Anncaliia algerae PRA339 TaxID=1288291 RepID=A0A059F1W1_9MICR|nr:hypothetical protein H312_01457 [Anncaliia algerae PRA339]